MSKELKDLKVPRKLGHPAADAMVEAWCTLRQYGRELGRGDIRYDDVTFRNLLNILQSTALMLGAVLANQAAERAEGIDQDGRT